MDGDISLATRTELLGAIRSRYREASKKDKSRMLDEFVAMTGCHRKHAVRLLGQGEDSSPRASQGTEDIRRGCEGGTDGGVGSLGQDMWEETQGGTAEYGGVTWRDTGISTWTLTFGGDCLLPAPRP